MKKGNGMMADTIEHAALCRLAAAGEINGAQVIGQPGGWALKVSFGQAERPLAAQRSKQIRVFKRLETLVTYLQEIGIARFEVNAENYDPHSTDATLRPDRSVALKRAHQAAAYEEWLREQVQASMDDSRPALSHDDAQALFAKKKAALRK
ncbi:antitoxin PaaA2 family protein [Serratia sp. TSA_198.1]|nr:hypothetical protein [Serratia plymuthica]UNK28343.1 hypothetical protein MNO11_00860 [Serratia plymuthica]